MKNDNNSLTKTVAFLAVFSSAVVWAHTKDLQQTSANPITKSSVQTELVAACQTEDQKREVAEVLSISLSVLNSFLESKNNDHLVLPPFRKYRKDHPNRTFHEHMEQLRKAEEKTQCMGIVQPVASSIYEWEKCFQKVVRENLLVPTKWKNMEYIKQYFVLLNEKFPEYMERLKLDYLHCPSVSVILIADENSDELYQAYETLRDYHRSHEKPITSVLKEKRHDEWLAEEEKKTQFKLTDLLWIIPDVFTSCLHPHSPKRACNYKPVNKRE